VQQGLQRTQAQRGFVHQHLGHEVEHVRTQLALEDLRPLRGLDLRELLLVLVLVHQEDLLLGRRAQHLDDLDQLVDCALAREERVAQQHLADDCAHAPDVDRHRLVGGAEDQLGRALVAAADVAHVGLARDQPLGRAEVADLEHVRGGVDQQVLRLDVAVADALRVDLGHRAEHLPALELHQHQRQVLLVLGLGARDARDRVGYELRDRVQLQLVLLLALGLEGVLELDDVRVVQLAQDLQFSVLLALVLLHLLDRDHLARLLHVRLKHDPERALPHHLLRLLRPLRIRPPPV